MVTDSQSQPLFLAFQPRTLPHTSPSLLLKFESAKVITLNINHVVHATSPESIFSNYIITLVPGVFS